MSSINHLVDDELKKDINQTISFVKIYLRQRFNEKKEQLNNQIKLKQQEKEKQHQQEQEQKEQKEQQNKEQLQQQDKDNNNKDNDNKDNNLTKDETLIKKIENEPKKKIFSCEHVDNVPEYLKRDYIIYGYRVNFSILLAIRSIFMPFHNEFANIHSHLWPAVYFIYLALDSIYFNDDFQYIDRVVFALFLLSGISTFVFSVLWHSLGCHSYSTWKNLLLCDYMGIIFLIVGSFYPPLYYSFRCNTSLMIGYMSTITVLGVTLACLIFMPAFAQHNRLRTLLFTLTAFFGIVPSTHVLYLYPWEIGSIFFYRINVMFGLFGLGLVFYVAKIPERWLPGLLDNIISSHSIWHIFTFLAPLYHYHTCRIAFSATSELACAAL